MFLYLDSERKNWKIKTIRENFSYPTKHGNVVYAIMWTVLVGHLKFRSTTCFKILENWISQSVTTLEELWANLFLLQTIRKKYVTTLRQKTKIQLFAIIIRKTDKKRKKLRDIFVRGNKFVHVTANIIMDWKFKNRTPLKPSKV